MAIPIYDGDNNDNAGPSSPSPSPSSAATSSLRPPSLSTSDPIPLHLVEQQAYVWEIEHVKRLRVDHHICGVLTGTLPHVSQQNVFLGLPLQLFPEEVAVLLKYGLGVLVNDVSAHHPPTLDQSTSYASTRLSRAQGQQESHARAEAEKQAEMQAKYGKEIQRKREEKAEKRRRAAELKPAEGLLETEQGPSEHKQGDASPRRQQRPESASPAHAETSQNASESHEHHQQAAPAAPSSSSQVQPESRSKPNIPFSIITETATSTAQHPWYAPVPRTNGRLSDPTSGVFAEPHPESALFSFPSSTDGMQLARSRVFEDLWLRGYYMGKGLKFGGDYLCYPGDPLRFHSHFTATVIPTPDGQVRPIDIVSWGRLATAVKKACLLATWDAKKDQVRYISLEWAGFG